MLKEYTLFVLFNWIKKKIIYFNLILKHVHVNHARTESEKEWIEYNDCWVWLSFKRWQCKWTRCHHFSNKWNVHFISLVPSEMFLVRKFECLGSHMTDCSVIISLKISKISIVRKVNQLNRPWQQPFMRNFAVWENLSWVETFRARN